MSLMIVILALTASQSPICEYRKLKQVRGSGGIEAIERLRLCMLTPAVVTGDDEVLIKNGKPAKLSAVLVRLNSVGKAGVPITWEVDHFVLHVPVRATVRIATNKALSIVEIRRDYTTQQFLRDNDVRGVMEIR